MGLDMYVLKRKIRTMGENGEYQEAIYWRKANQIRNWFCDKLGYSTMANMEMFAIDIEDLRQLEKDCLYVLNNPDEADIEMPTSSGFFFGSMEYDEDYFYQLKYTVEEIKKVLAADNGEYEYAYYEWW